MIKEVLEKTEALEEKIQALLAEEGHSIPVGKKITIFAPTVTPIVPSELIIV